MNNIGQILIIRIVLTFTIFQLIEFQALASENEFQFTIIEKLEYQQIVEFFEMYGVNLENLDLETDTYIFDKIESIFQEQQKNLTLPIKRPLFVHLGFPERNSLKFSRVHFPKKLLTSKLIECLPIDPQNVLLSFYQNTKKMIAMYYESTSLDTREIFGDRYFSSPPYITLALLQEKKTNRLFLAGAPCADQSKYFSQDMIDYTDQEMSDLQIVKQFFLKIFFLTLWIRAFFIGQI